MAGWMRLLQIVCYLYTEYQPQVLQTQQTQWQPSYLVTSNCVYLVFAEVLPALRDAIGT